MPPKRSGGGGGGGGGGDKKQQLWEGIRTQKLQAVRFGLANAGILPTSRNEDGQTTFMICATYNLDKYIFRTP